MAKAKTILRVAVKTLLILAGSIVGFVIVFALFFFAVPEITLPIGRLDWAINRFLPENVRLSYTAIDARITKPGRLFFAKRVELGATDLCVVYGAAAVRSCFNDVRISAVAGWGGERRKGESVFLPRLISIDPLFLLGGRAAIDMNRFPPSEPKREPAKKNEFSVQDFVRTQILPKWNFEGSRVELERFRLRQGKRDITAQFDLTTLEGADTLKAVLKNFDLGAGGPKGEVILRVRKPTEGQLAEKRQTGDKIPPRAWKVFLEGGLTLPARRFVELKADADVSDWQTLDFRVATKLKNIATIREARLEGELRGDQSRGKFSLKMGSRQSEIQALDFVNCDYSTDLKEKTGGLKCGPQAVRLALRERAVMGNPKLFIFAPEFELKVKDLLFGDVKGASFDFTMSLEHLGFISSALHLEGAVESRPGEPLKYKTVGGMDLRIERFKGIVDLLRRTPYSIPAPLNVLDGAVTSGVRLNVDQDGGEIPFTLSADLDSKHQRAKLSVESRTVINRQKKGLRPSTDAVVKIDELRLSAPRFELKPPPQMAPDSRFGRVVDPREERLQRKSAASPPDFILHVLTTRPEAIRISTNHTQKPIPLDFDLHYYSEGALARGAIRFPENRAPDQIPRRVLAAVKSDAGGARPVSEGHLHVGRTPVEIFKRLSTVETLNVTLEPTGERVFDGRLAVDYPDYEIKVLLGGNAEQPQLVFESNPPLKEDQIIAVLLFGRPLTDLDESQQESVSNLNAAVTDAVLGIGSLYFLANSPIESIGYDPERERVTAKVSLGGGATLELGGFSGQNAGVGVRKRLSREWVLRSDVERVGPTSTRTVSAFIEWVKRY